MPVTGAKTHHSRSESRPLNHHPNHTTESPVETAKLHSPRPHEEDTKSKSPGEPWSIAFKVPQMTLMYTRAENTLAFVIIFLKSDFE